MPTSMRDRFTRGVLHAFGVKAPYSDADLNEGQRAELYEGAQAFARQANIAPEGEPRLVYVAQGTGSAVQSALVSFGEGDVSGNGVLIAAERNAQGQLEFHLAEQDEAGVARETVLGANLFAPASSEPAGLLVGDLERLAALRSQGMINDQEFAAAKARLLS